MIDAAPLPVGLAGDRSQLSDEFLSRVQECYRRSAAAEDAPGAIWGGLAARNSAFTNALASRDPEILRPFVGTLYSGDLLLGMGHVQAFVVGRKTIYPQKYFSMRLRDAVLALGEALAVVHPASNQQTPLREYRNRLRSDPSEQIAAIERCLGHPIDVPEIGCPPVVRVAGRNFNPDLVRHAYIPHRLEQLDIAPDDPVLEIGGGYGVVARYAVLRGHRAWTIVDLPYVNAIQMLWIGATLGPEFVSGTGEPRAAIHLHPSTDKPGLVDDYALALNMDSLPEMPVDEAAHYLDLIEARCRRFLSVNQEAAAGPRRQAAQNVVPQLMAGRSLRRVSRHPYWMEQGYVEELYAVAGA